MVRAWYSGTLEKFLAESSHEKGVASTPVFAQLNNNAANFSIMPTQRDVWKEEIELLIDVIGSLKLAGRIYFEYEFPRIGRRADVVLLVNGCLLCLEFKGGDEAEKPYTMQDKDQALDYALDFADFNSESHDCPIVPFLVVTHGADCRTSVEVLEGGVHKVVCTNTNGLCGAIKYVLENVKEGIRIPEEKYDAWERATYEPTPTIVQAAERLFENSKVEDITRAGADVNLSIEQVEKIISWAQAEKKKVVCFVTGQPGAGKTLVGLKLATASTVVPIADGGDGIRRANRVFLSGNFPLVHVLQQALVRDFMTRLKDCEDSLNADNGAHEINDAQKTLLQVCGLKDMKTTNGKKKIVCKHRLVSDGARGMRSTRFSKKGLTEIFDAKIQLVSRFRSEYKSEDVPPPNEHVFVFDEAQRAWDAKQIGRKDKKSCPFQVLRNMSEPEALLRYLSLPRPEAEDWCVAVALVGHGQDIHQGEAGIRQWYDTLAMRDGAMGDLVFKNWEVCFSAANVEITPEIATVQNLFNGHVNKVPLVDYDKLHLETTMRSYHAPRLSDFVDSILKGRTTLNESRALLRELRGCANPQGKEPFPLRITRDLEKAKAWVVEHGYGSLRRYGLLVSSRGVRLRRYGFNSLANGFDEVAWFLDPKNTINSSYAMEIAASEFKVQGLEIDYSIVGWDGDFWYDSASGEFKCRHFSVSKNRWLEVVDDAPDGDDTNGEDQPSTRADKIRHLINAYRVILTRARQGMIIYIPNGEPSDESNLWKGNYDSTYEYLKNEVGVPELV